MYGVQIELIDEDSIIEPVIVAESLKAESEMNQFLFDNPDAKQNEIRLKQQEIMNASKNRINELIFGEMITSIDRVVRDNPQFESYFVKAKTAKDIFTILSELSQSEKLEDKNAFIAFNRALRDFYGFRGTD
jgi:single-stranded DNA-specific DHH superfamily exonuclease